MIESVTSVCPVCGFDRVDSWYYPYLDAFSLAPHLNCESRLYESEVVRGATPNPVGRAFMISYGITP